MREVVLVFAIGLTSLADAGALEEESLFLCRYFRMLYEGGPLIIEVFSEPNRTIEVLEQMRELRKRHDRGVVDEAQYRKEYDRLSAEIEALRPVMIPVPEEYEVVVWLSNRTTRFQAPRVYKDKKITDGDGREYIRVFLSTLGIPPGSYKPKVSIRVGEAVHDVGYAYLAKHGLKIWKVEDDFARVQRLKQIEETLRLYGQDYEKAREYSVLLARLYPEELGNIFSGISAAYFEQGDKIGFIALLLLRCSRSQKMLPHNVFSFLSRAKEVSLEEALKALPLASELSEELFGEDCVNQAKAEKFLRSVYKMVEDGVLKVPGPRDFDGYTPEIDMESFPKPF